MLTLEMVYEKSTKNTHRFKGIEEGEAPIDTLYIIKTAFDKGEPPKKIRVTIEGVE